MVGEVHKLAHTGVHNASLVAEKAAENHDPEMAVAGRRPAMMPFAWSNADIYRRAVFGHQPDTKTPEADWASGV